MIERCLALFLLMTPALAQDEQPAEAAAPVLTKAPELIEQVEAVYPEKAFADGLAGQVVLRITIDETGTVTEAVVEQPIGNGFDEAALTAVKQFRFTPAEVDDKPSPVQILYTYAFTIEKQVEEVAVEVDDDSPQGSLSGVVLEKGTRAPLPGFTVRIKAGDEKQETYTDAEGRFRFDGVPAGDVEIEIDDPAFYTLADEEAVKAGEVVEVTYYLERQSGDVDTLTVTAKRTKKEVARRTLTMQEIRKIPGTQGDALKVVQNLPGVARVPFGGGALIVRGSNPGDSGAVINRHYIPIAFHFGGLRSVFPSELLESIDFYPGNFGAEFGRFAGGVVDVRIRRPKDDGLHGRVEADVFDAGFLIEGPLHEGGTFALSGRRSYIDVLLPLFLPEDAGLDFTVAPRYYDYQALYDLKIGAHRVRSYFFGSFDALEFLLKRPPSQDPSIRGDFKNETQFFRLYTAWNFRISEDLENEFSLAVGKNLLFFAGGPGLFFDNDVTIFTAREDLDWRVNDNVRLRMGFDVEAYLGRVVITAPGPPKEGTDPTPLGTRDLKSIDRDFNFIDPAAWIEAELKLGDWLVVPGLRADFESETGDYTIDPRINARYQLAEGTVLKGGIGLYMQRPTPDEVDDTFGNPNLELERSMHASAGFERQITDAIEVDWVVFYKHLYNSVSSDADPEIVYNNDGVGRIYGMELLVRHNLARRFFGWVAYTLMRSERKDATSSEFRRFDFDQTHIFTVLGQYKLTNNWEIGGRWRYTSGNPQTLRQGGIYDSDADTYVPFFGENNGKRLPAFHQLDIRVDRNWIFDTWRFTAYLEIQNVYNRQNPENFRYNYFYTQRDFVTGTPIIPSLGLRGEF